MGAMPYLRKAGVAEYLPLAAGAVLTLVFFHALLMWGDGLTVNINILSGAGLGSLTHINPSSSSMDPESQELLRALEAASLTSRHTRGSRPLLGFTAEKKAVVDGPAHPDTAPNQASGEASKVETQDVKTDQVKEERTNVEQAPAVEVKKEETKKEEQEGESKGEGKKEEKLGEGKEGENKGDGMKEENKKEGKEGENKKVEKVEEPKAEEKKDEGGKKENQENQQAQKTEEPKKVEDASSAPNDKVPTQHEPLPPGAEGTRDWAEVERLKVIMKPLVKDNTVVVTPANAGFLDMALNLRCRLLSLGWTQTLFWALDKESADKFEAEGIPHYYDASLFSVTNAKGYHDPDYIRMMSERPRVWWRFLATGYDLLFLDADVVAFDSPDRYFDRTADLEGQVDGWGWEFEKSRTNSSNLCAGAFWVRSSPTALEFMVRAFHSFKERQGQVERWDDQLALNWVLHTPSFAAVITAGAPQGQKFRTDVPEGIFKVAFSEPERVLPGHLYWAAQRTGSKYDVTFSIKVHETDTPYDFKPSLLHLNGHGKKAEKVERMKQNGWWDLSDDGTTCKTP